VFDKVVLHLSQTRSDDVWLDRPMFRLEKSMHNSAVLLCATGLW